MLSSSSGTATTRWRKPAATAGPNCRTTAPSKVKYASKTATTSPSSLVAQPLLQQPAKSGLGHVWTAPWQEPSDVIAALVGCGHVSGLLMRLERPLALMLCADRVPIELLHLEVR